MKHPCRHHGGYLTHLLQESVHYTLSPELGWLIYWKQQCHNETAAEFFISSPPKRRIFALLIVAADLIIIFAIMRICPSTHRVRRLASYYLKQIILIHFASWFTLLPLHAKCVPYRIPTSTHTQHNPIGHWWKRRKIKVKKKKSIFPFPFTRE